MGQTSKRHTHRSRVGDPFWDLAATARRLHAPSGCAWDRSQTAESLLPYLIEETWEVFEAIRSRRREGLQEELGDILYTVLFLTLIAERQGWFDLTSLLTATREKMVRRHPHVFGTTTASSPETAYQQWQRSKRLEGKKPHSPSEAFRKRLVASWDRLLAQSRADGRHSSHRRPREGTRRRGR